MTEQRESRLRGAARRMIDWSKLGGFVLDWAFAIGELVFSVLAAGLVGGIFGGFVDVALALFRDEWAGYGRMIGWTAGAVSTAIGMPLAWVRGDDRKWSLPSPRKLRKNVADKTRKRRNKRSYDFQSIGDVLQGTAALGLIGGILGFMLGGALLMSWFSLAMSPFATADWLEALEFQPARDFHDNTFRRDEDRGGTVITTDDPIASYLFFSPVLIVGAGGVIFGTAYGAAQYAAYLLNVPADVRERKRKEKREPVVEQRQATAAAIKQRLQPLAPAPREVPLAIRWQLLGEGLGFGMLLGAIFFIAGTVAMVALFLGWRNDPQEVPLVAVTFGAIFLVVGSVFAVVSVRECRGRIRILRYGYVSRCRIATCQHPQTGDWRSYATLLEQLRDTWDKPIADFNTKADTKSFERFGTIFGVASMVVFGFMGVGGGILTVALVYAAIVERELVAWLGLGFFVFWWTLIVAMARLFWRNIRMARNIGRQSLKTLGIKPIVDCRVEFELPDGKTVKAKTKLDLASRLAPERSEPDDVVAYDPWEPTHALLLSRFRPPLMVGESGQWQFRDGTQPTDASPPAS